MTVRHLHRVRYHEVDQQGYLFNSRYLEIADVAMVEFFRDLGWTYPELNAAGMDPSVVEARLRFRGPARFDDELAVDVTCARLGHSSFDLAMHLSCGDRDIALIDIVYVNVDSTATSSRPVPSQVAPALAPEGTL